MPVAPRRVNEALRALDRQLLLVDAVDVEMPDAYRLKGRYRANSDGLRIDIRVQCGMRTVTNFSLDLKYTDLDRGAQDVVAQLLIAIENSQGMVLADATCADRPGS